MLVIICNITYNARSATLYFFQILKPTTQNNYPTFNKNLIKIIKTSLIMYDRYETTPTTNQNRAENNASIKKQSATRLRRRLSKGFFLNIYLEKSLLDCGLGKDIPKFFLWILLLQNPYTSIPTKSKANWFFPKPEFFHAFCDLPGHWLARSFSDEATLPLVCALTRLCLLFSIIPL